VQKVGKRLLTDVDLELELTEWQWAALVFLEDGVEDVEFGSFNVELENINESVSVLPHETLERVFRWAGRRVVFWLQLPWLEVDAALELGNFTNLRSPLFTPLVGFNLKRSAKKLTFSTEKS
jgi:hypothetical protein